MLARMVKEHQARQQVRKERQDWPIGFTGEHDDSYYGWIEPRSDITNTQNIIRKLCEEAAKQNKDKTDPWVIRAIVEHFNMGLTPHGVFNLVHSLAHLFLEIRKKEASAAATALTHALVDHLNTGVAQAYVNQKKLDTETKILQANATHFAKQTMQWLKLVEDFNQSLKEIGDVENWAKSIETDMRTISSALEYAYKGEKT